MTFFYSTLSTLGILAVVGTKAKEFLQGQTTCDLRVLTAGKGIVGACCNNKGRVLATFIAAAYPEGAMLVMDYRVIPVLMKHLQKYAPLHQVKLENQTSEFVIVNSWNESLPLHFAPDVLQFSIDAPSRGQYFIVARNQITSLQQEISQQGQEISEEQWHCQRLQQGVPFIYPQTFAKFTPHQLNLPKLGYVSYDKGCYTGQEIIARMHYRGQDQVKQSLYLHEFPYNATLEPGATITVSDTQQSGEIIDLAPINSSTLCALVLY